MTILNDNLPSRRQKQISLDVNRALGPRMASAVSPAKTKVPIGFFLPPPIRGLTRGWAGVGR